MNLLYPKKRPKKEDKIKGKLITGSRFCSLNKEKFGSIPSKTENILLPDSLNKTDLNGFSSHSERFIIKTNENPGVGKYNIDTSSFLYNEKSQSSKGYGIGFVSKNDRISYTKNTNPGPGKYFEDNEILSLNYKMEKSLIGKSLYNSKISYPLKEERTELSPSSYYPKYIGDKRVITYNFYSSPGRDEVFNPANKDNPGPGKYFNGEFVKKNKPAPIETEGAQDIKRYINNKNHQELLDKYNINRGFSKKDLKFRLFNGKDSNKLNNDHQVTNDERLQNMHMIYLKTEKDDIEKEDEIRVIDRELNVKRNRFVVNRTKGAISYKPLIRNIKEDLFYLARPRWKENKYEFKTPGPAYYLTRNVKEKYSYNKNVKDFIFPGGQEYQEYR